MLKAGIILYIVASIIIYFRIYTSKKSGNGKGITKYISSGVGKIVAVAIVFIAILLIGKIFLFPSHPHIQSPPQKIHHPKKGPTEQLTVVPKKPNFTGNWKLTYYNPSEEKQYNLDISVEKVGDCLVMKNYYKNGLITFRGDKIGDYKYGGQWKQTSPVYGGTFSINFDPKDPKLAAMEITLSDKKTRVAATLYR